MIPLKWVTIPKFCELTGYSPGAVAKKLQRGVWLQGRVWRKSPDGRIQINLEEYEQWVEGKTAA
jgi:hypothetical protein